MKLRTTVVALALLAGASAPARADVPPPPAGYSLVWSDDFAGAAGSALSGADWRYDTGTHYPCADCPAQWGTGEVETMTDSTDNVFQDGAGHLVIRALDGAQGWTSGRVETQRSDFAAPDGGILRIQGALQLPNLTGPAAQGYWPAFWALGAPFRPDFAGWPGIGELDIMENVDGQNTDYGTLHCGVAPGGPCNEFNGRGGTTPGGDPALQAGFHTYAIELDRGTSPQQLRWYLDGREFFAVDSTQVDAQTWENATHHGFFVILDLAMGGGFPGSPTDATASGGSMVVDYVAAYTEPPAAPPTLSLQLGPGGDFGSFTPGPRARLRGDRHGGRAVDRGERAAERDRPGHGPGPPGQRRVRPALAADRGGHQPGRQRVGAGRAGRGAGPAAQLRGTGDARPGDGRLHPAHRRRRSAADRRLCQGADLHVVDDSALSAPGAALRVTRSGAGTHRASWPNGRRSAPPSPTSEMSESSAASRSGEPLFGVMIAATSAVVRPSGNSGRISAASSAGPRRSRLVSRLAISTS